MIFISLTRFHDFLQFIGIKRDDSNKYEYFYKQEKFTMIYLLQKQGLKHN
jgi:hypothetical protein